MNLRNEIIYRKVKHLHLNLHKTQSMKKIKLSTNWFKIYRIIGIFLAIFCLISFIKPNSFFENYHDNNTPLAILIASICMIIFSFLFNEVHFDYNSKQIISKRIFCKPKVISKEKIEQIENVYGHLIRIRYQDNSIKRKIIFTPRISFFIPSLNPAKNIKEWINNHPKN